MPEIVGFARQCGWCATVHTGQEHNCVNCGGPLPSFPGEDRGQEPPPAPRVLPKSYVRKVRYTGNVLVMIGILFSTVFIWTVIFPIIGGFLWYFGARSAARQLNALEQGVPTEGKLLFAQLDHSTTVNGRHPVRLEYAFMTPQGSVTGHVSGWDYSNLQRQPGEPLWIVYLPDDPDQNSIWPPVR